MHSFKNGMGIVLVTLVLLALASFQALVNRQVVGSLFLKATCLRTESFAASPPPPTGISDRFHIFLKGSDALVWDQRRIDLLVKPLDSASSDELYTPPEKPTNKAVESGRSDKNAMRMPSARVASSVSVLVASARDVPVTDNALASFATRIAQPSEHPQAVTAEEQTSPMQRHDWQPTSSNSSSVLVYDGPGSIWSHFTDSSKELYWKGWGPIELFAKHYFQRTNRYCLSIDEALSDQTGGSVDKSAPSDDNQRPIVHLHIEFECKELFYNSGYGTGNIITLLYGMRLSSLVRGNVSLNFTCTDADSTKQDLILPWLTGYFPPRLLKETNPYPNLSTNDVCGAYFTSQIVHMYRDVQYDLRRMAIGLVGVPNEHHPAAMWLAEVYASESDNKNRQEWTPQVALNFKDHDQRTVDPVFFLHGDSSNSVSSSSPRDIVLDDAVLHFRCGDLMDSTHGEFAFLPFASFVNDISPEAKSIGIITQPFPRDQIKATEINHYQQQARFSDAAPKTQDRCKIVVGALVDYIARRHPHARISVHNGPNETIALAYARMIMANQTVVGISTFGVFPALSTFGTGYLHQPHGPFVNGWMSTPVRIDTLASNVQWVHDTKYIMVADMKRLWETQGASGVVAWFRGGGGDNDVAPTMNQTADSRHRL